MNTMSVVRLIQKAANRFGVDIREYKPQRSGFGQLSLMLADQNINLVLDVGANTGQFAKSLRAAGYTKQLVSFEPQSNAHRQLLQASRNDPQWEIAPRTAIGDHEGEVEMHIAGNSVSSSVLDMLESHKIAAPNSAYVGTERAPLSCLDTMTHTYLQPATIPFLKIDTQGYEDRVLDGASDLLAKARGLHMELSFVPLYAGQKLFDDLVQRLQNLGFSIWSISPGFCDPRSGRMLQVDATFFRNGS
jgi:FkbM family methyltransferase